MSKIIFGFLGSLPENDLWEHWANFFKGCLEKNKEDILLCLHPKESDTESYNNYLSKINLLNVFKNDNILVLSGTNQILTEWGTNSLADATLLMMQTCLMKFKTIKKFILVSNTCCPIYNINYIISELQSNSKSYINGNDANELEKTTEKQELLKFFNDKKFFNQKSFNNINYSLYYSNWMILDIQHIKYFFTDDTINFNGYNIEGNNIEGNKTYIKKRISNEYVCKSKNEIIIVNVDPNKKKTTELQELKDFFTKPYFKNSDIHDGKNINRCWPIEEIIFGNYIIKKIISEGKKIEDEIMITNIDTIKNNVIKNKLAYDKIFNEYYNETSCKFNIINPIKNEVNNNNTISESDIEVCVGTKISFFEDDNIRFNSSTYTDWSKISLDPKNVFRNFKMSIFHLHNLEEKRIIDQIIKREDDDLEKQNTLFNKILNKNEELKNKIKWINFDIKDFLNKNNPEDALKSLIDNDENLQTQKYLKLFNNELIMSRSYTLSPLIPTSWHPIEYGSWSIKNMVNSLVLMSYLNKIFLNNQYLDKKINNFIEIYEIYKKTLIDKEVIKMEKIVIDNIIIEVPKLLEPYESNSDFYNEDNYGYKLTPDSIISARSMGSFFIRKCVSNSGISIYSNILFEDPKLYINKILNKLIIDNLSNYGVNINNLEELKKFNESYRNKEINKNINKCFKFEFFKDVFKMLAFGKFVTKNNNNESIKNTNMEEDLLIIKDKSISSTYLIGEYKAKGAWNMVYSIKDIKNPSEELVFRFIYQNEDYSIRTFIENLIVSYYDNIINIIITILQKIINKNLVNESVILAIDVNTFWPYYPRESKSNYNSPEEIKELEEIDYNQWKAEYHLKEIKKKKIIEIYKVSSNIFSINKKVDGDCLEFIYYAILINNKPEDLINIFNKLCMKIFNKLKCLQEMFLFIHGDFKLDNILFIKKDKKKNYELDNIEPLISDLGNSSLTVDNFRYEGNPFFEVINYNKTNNEYYYGKDIVYFFINALSMFYKKYNEKNTISNTPEIKIKIDLNSNEKIVLDSEQKKLFKNGLEYLTLIILSIFKDIFKDIINQSDGNNINHYDTLFILSTEADNNFLINLLYASVDIKFVKTILTNKKNPFIASNIFKIDYSFKEFLIIINILNNYNFFMKYLKYKNKYNQDKNSMDIFRQINGNYKNSINYFEKYIKYKTKHLNKKSLKSLEILKGGNDTNLPQMVKILRDNMISVKKNKYDFIVRDSLYDLFNIIQDIDKNDVDTLQEKIRNIVNTDSFKTINYNKCIHAIKCKYTTNYDIIMPFYNDQRADIIYKIDIPTDKNDTEYYVFMISTLGFKFYKIVDSLEYGSSHLHLIDNNNERIIIAGELSVKHNEISYNFSSGTFSLVIKNEYKDYYLNMLHIFKALIEIILLYLTNFTNEIEINYTIEELLNTNFKNIISEESLENICNNNKDKFTTYKIIHKNASLDKTCHLNSLTRITDLDTTQKYNLIKNKIQDKIKNNNYIKLEDDDNLLCSDKK